MPSFLQPDPLMLAFLALKQGVYLEVLALFALLRAALARGPARVAAAVACLLCVLFVAARLLPPILGWSGGAFVLLGGWVRASLGGMTAPLICSGLMVAAAVLPGRRYRGLDLMHGLGFAGLLGLWAYTLLA